MLLLFYVVLLSLLTFFVQSHGQSESWFTICTMMVCCVYLPIGLRIAQLNSLLVSSCFNDCAVGAHTRHFFFFWQNGHIFFDLWLVSHGFLALFFVLIDARVCALSLSLFLHRYPAYTCIEMRHFNIWKRRQTDL